MKTFISCVAMALLFSASTALPAAEAAKANVYRDYTDTVDPAHQDAYEAGQKAWNACLKSHGSKFSWTVWNHDTGNTYQYSAVAGPYTWADFDAIRADLKACDSVWNKEANPHFKHETSTFMVAQADMSHMPKDAAKQWPPAMISVTQFNLKGGHEAHEAFANSVKKIAAAAEKSNWSAYFTTLEINYGGEGSPDYVVILPNKSWAEVGMEANPPLWKMMEGVYGKGEADTIRKSLNDSIAKSSSHIDSYNAALSYIAGK